MYRHIAEIIPQNTICIALISRHLTVYALVTERMFEITYSIDAAFFPAEMHCRRPPHFQQFTAVLL